MIESEAKSAAIKETEYCYVLACAWEADEKDSICLERIFTKGGCEEIRLARWKDGKQMMRPADLNAVDWVPLFKRAVEKNVFSDKEKLGMLTAIFNHSV